MYGQKLGNLEYCGGSCRGFHEVVGDDRRLIAVYHQVLHVHVNGHCQKITGPVEVVFLAKVLEGAIKTVGHVFGQKILPTAPVDGGEVVADGLLGAHMCLLASRVLPVRVRTSPD